MNEIIEIENKISGLYPIWLMENYPDEFMCKDKLIEGEENMAYYDEFESWIKNILFP